MPAQGPQWTEFLSCHVCFNMFDERVHRPISLGCGHTICKSCLSNLTNGKCPFDQSAISRNVDDLPANYALLQLVGAAIPKNMRENEDTAITTENQVCYTTCNKCIEDLAVNLKSDASDLKSEDDQDDDYTKNSHMGNLPSNSLLSRPMQRKLVALVNCQLLEEEGRSRAMRAARSLGERAVTELILQHQNPHQLSANLWAAVRTRGCQFLGPAMQEEVLRLILLVLEDASSLSRKVLVLFVVQQLEESYPQASKTAIGHVVQLLYRASCFKVTKREEESSLMQLKEEFRTYEALRREHDSQIVQIAMEAGLRISPEQWSSLLYGDTTHKSHMQSIIDKLQTPQSFTQSLGELSIALQRTGDPCNLQHLRPHLEFLANVDPSPDAPHPTWENLEAVLKALRTVVQGLVGFFSTNNMKKNELLPLQNARYKTSMCRDQSQQGMCPRGNSCTFAHSQEELERYRARSKRLGVKGAGLVPTFASLSPKEKAELDKVNKQTSQKLALHIKQPETDVQTKTNSEDKNLKSTKEASVAQSMVNLSLSSKPPADNVCGPNSGIPKGNMTPSVAAPAYYRAPTLGAGTSVKETYFHPRMPQGATRMSPYEMEGHRYNNPGYMMNPPMQGVPPPMGQYPAMNYPKPEAQMHQQGFPHDPYNMCDHQRSLTGTEQWGTPQQCYGQPDTLHEVQPQWPHHGNYSSPGYNQQPYYQGSSASSLQSPPPTTPPYSSQDREYLNNLHHRRNTILAHLHQQGPSRTGRNGKTRLPPQGSRSGQNQGYITKTSIQQASAMGLAESVADTYVATRTMFSLATSGLLIEPQAVSSSYVPSSYVPWSSDDCSDMNEKIDVKIDQSLALASDELVPKRPTKDKTEIVKDDSESLFNWFKEESEHIKQLEDYSSSTSNLHSDALFIPFDQPLVSKFGPIARMSRSRLKNTNPVQVTADETIKRMTPVTAVKAMDCPLPVTSQVPTRFCVHETPSYNTSPIPAIPTGQEVLSPKWHNSPESQFMLQSDPTGLSRKHLQQEVTRLENKAQDAASTDESLAFELRAINLKISLQNGQKPPNKKFTSKPAIPESSKSLGTVRASDPTLTVEEHRKLHELATTMGSSGKQCSEQQERLLSQLLKLQDLSKQSSQKRNMDMKVQKKEGR